MPESTATFPEFAVLGGMEADARQRLLAQLPRRELRPGEVVIREGEPNRYLVLVARGRLQAERTDAGGRMIVGDLGPGDCGGEMSALSGAGASASVRALTSSSVFLLSPHHLSDDASGTVAVRLAQLVIARLTQTIDQLEGKRQLAVDAMNLRLRSAIFGSKLLCCLSLYVLVLGLAYPLRHYWPAQPIVSGFFILTFFGAAWAFVTRVSDVTRFGMSPRGGVKASLRGVGLTVPLLAATLLAKAVYVRLHPGHGWFEPLAALGGGDRISWGVWFGTLLGYVVLSYGQEVVRCATQACLADYRRGGNLPDGWRSIILSSVMFGATHVHLGLGFALVSSVVGVFWAWVYQRERSYWAAAASHASLGAWALFIVHLPV